MDAGEQHVIKHYSKPYHRGVFPGKAGAVYFGTAVSDTCHDTVAMVADIQNDVIVEIWWTGTGCCFSQAGASMLAEYARGKTVDEMVDFGEAEMFDLFQADFQIERSSCILTASVALQNLLEKC